METTMKKQFISRLLVSLLSISVSSGLLAATGNIGGTSLAVLGITPGVNMDFGSIVAIGNGNLEADGQGAISGVATPNLSAYLDMALDGTRSTGVGGAGTATISLLPGAGVPATFVVNGVVSTLVRFTSPLILDADSTAVPISLVNGVNSFLLTDLILDTDGDNLMNNDVLIPDPAGVNAAGFTVWGTTDAVTGNINVGVSGRIYTIELATPNLAYPDGAYTGNVDIVVSY